MRYFKVCILNVIITLDNATDDQVNLIYELDNSKKSTKQRTQGKKQWKRTYS